MASTYVEALLEERVGYERHGRTDRVAAVDAELARLNIAVADEPVDPDPELEALAALDEDDLAALAELDDEQRAELAELLAPEPPAPPPAEKPKREPRKRSQAKS